MFVLFGHCKTTACLICWKVLNRGARGMKAGLEQHILGWWGQQSRWRSCKPGLHVQTAHAATCSVQISCCGMACPPRTLAVLCHRHQGGRAHLSRVPAGLSRASFPTPSGCDPDFQAMQPPGSMLGPPEGDQEDFAPQCRVCWAPDGLSNLLNPCSCKGPGGAAGAGGFAGPCLAHQAAPGSVSAIAGGSLFSGPPADWGGVVLQPLPPPHPASVALLTVHEWAGRLARSSFLAVGCCRYTGAHPPEVPAAVARKRTKARCQRR